MEDVGFVLLVVGTLATVGSFVLAAFKRGRSKNLRKTENSNVIGSGDSSINIQSGSGSNINIGGIGKEATVRQEIEPASVIEHRNQIKAAFQKNLPRRGKYGTFGEAILRDIDRIDIYPDTEAGKDGWSAWQKVEIKGLYYRGIEFFIFGADDVVYDAVAREWRFAREADSKEDKCVAFPVGQVPFDRIISVDWEGDEMYRMPHFYCKFGNRELYESIPFYRVKQVNGDEYHVIIEGFLPWNKKKVK